MRSHADVLVAFAVTLAVPFAVPESEPGSESLLLPVRLVLDQTRYPPGAHGHVTVQVGQNGYLVVLYADPNGHVRIAFPLDPGLDAAVEEGTDIPIHARGRLDAFTVEDSTGTGTWYAAISKRPFHFDSIAVGGHWDYRDVPRVSDPGNAEHELTAFVQRIATGRFDYDIVPFRVSIYTTTANAGPAPEPRGPHWPGPWMGPWGWPWPGPWLPKPWPGPGPRYDSPDGQSPPAAAPSPAEPRGGSRSPAAGGRAPDGGPPPAPPRRSHRRGDRAPDRNADHSGDRKPESGSRGPRF